MISAPLQGPELLGFTKMFIPAVVPETDIRVRPKLLGIRPQSPSFSGIGFSISGFAYPWLRMLPSVVATNLSRAAQKARTARQSQRQHLSLQNKASCMEELTGPGSHP